MLRTAALVGAAFCLVGCGPSWSPEPAAEAAPARDATAKSTKAPFGETPTERTIREAEEARVGLGDMWVKAEVATEHTSPGGPVVNRIYYRQKLTIYEKRGAWYRTTQDGFSPRWTRASLLTDTQPPEKPDYAGPPEFADSRIAPDAIPNPGEDGLTRRDVDIIRKGAKMVLLTRPGCGRIELGDKSVSKPNTYYVTCSGFGQNVFFTRDEVEAAQLD